MFTKETSIMMYDGQAAQLGRLAALGPATLLAATKKGNISTWYIPAAGDGPAMGDGNAQVITPLQTSVGEYITVMTASGRTLKCAPRTRLCLAGGGYVYANESNGAILDTETGPDIAQGPNTTGETCELVELRLSSGHAVLANGIWALTE